METNIFKILKVNHKENYHSQFLASLLEIEEFQKLFIERLNIISKVSINKKYKVKTEHDLNKDKKSRVDIFLYDDEKNRILIENKLYANDQFKQIKRYKDYLNNEQRKGSLFYLTLNEKKASNASSYGYKSGNDYFTISYHNFILPWLNEIKTICEDRKLLGYIDDYIIVVKELTKEWVNFEKKYNEIEEMTEEKENAFIEFKFWMELEQQLINRFDKNIDIDGRRYYSYDKALRNRKIKRKRKGNRKRIQKNNYGIIFKLNDDNDKLYIIRIDENLNIEFSIGGFDTWNKFKSIEILSIKNKKDVEEKAKEILGKILPLL